MKSKVRQQAVVVAVAVVGWAVAAPEAIANDGFAPSVDTPATVASAAAASEPPTVSVGVALPGGARVSTSASASGAEADAASPGALPAGTAVSARLTVSASVDEMAVAAAAAVAPLEAAAVISVEASTPPPVAAEAAAAPPRNHDGGAATTVVNGSGAGGKRATARSIDRRLDNQARPRAPLVAAGGAASPRDPFARVAEAQQQHELRANREAAVILLSVPEAGAAAAGGLAVAIALAALGLLPPPISRRRLAPAGNAAPSALHLLPPQRPG